MHQFNISEPFKGITIDITGPFLESKKGNQYLLIVVAYFAEWPEVCHTSPRVINNCKCSGDQYLLPDWGAEGTAQQQGWDFEF